MQRREFFRWSATRLGVLALFLVGGAAAVVGIGDIVRHLERRFAYLRIDRSDLQRFADAYVDTYGHPGPGEWPALESTFLLSTDFFTNEADESVPVHFVAIAEPWASPCVNPLARFDD